MAEQEMNSAEFVERFMDRKKAERYRDRYRSGRHARINEMERACLGKLLAELGPTEVSLDLPCGVGRLGDLMAKTAKRVILADTSPLMLEMAREELGDSKYTYLQTNAEKIDLPTGSVDLILCHRLLNHIPEADVRSRMVKELTRVTRRYLVMSCYPPGVRTRIKVFFRKLLSGGRPVKTQATVSEYLELAAQNNLRLVRRDVLRRTPFTAEFVVFERANA